jgi:hypothetical protein
MTDHFDRKDVPGSDVKGADPDVGVTVTVDSGGHLKKVEVDVHVPGSAPGSKPAHLEHGGDDPAKPKNPTWTPHLADPNEPVYNPLPVRPGWKRDPVTGVDYPDPAGVGASGGSGVSGDAGAGDAGAGDAGAGSTDAASPLPPTSEIGDFPEPDPNESIA